MTRAFQPGAGVALRPLALALTSLAFLPGAFAQDSSDAETTRLPAVVISAAGFEQEIKQAPASITVVTREELERRQVSSLAEALQGVEGVNVSGLDSRDGKTGNQSISLRGLPREYTLILIDGVRQNPMGNITPNSLNDALSAFIPPVAAIERIEIIRGPMATLYGSDALGGVVNVITRRAGDKWSGAGSISRTFQGDSDFGDKETIDAYIAGPLAQNFSLQLYGRQFDRQRSNVSIPGVTTPRAPATDTPTMGQNPSSAMIRTVGGKLLFTPNQQHELSLAFNVTDQTYDNKRGDIRAIHREGNPAGSACNTTAVPNFCRGYTDTLEVNREQITLGYQGRFDLGMLETKLTRDFLESKGRTIPLDNNTPLDIQGSKRTLELETWIFDTKFIAPIGEHNLLTVGGQYLRPEMTDGLWLGEKNSMRQYSVFAENEWRVTDTLALTGGLRYDDNEYFSGHLSPRAYAVWDATDRWTFKGGVGRGFRTPFIEQLSDGIIGYRNRGEEPRYGNPNLKPETSTNYEIAALYSDNRMTAQATAFRQDVKDLIEAGTGSNSNTTMNIGEARIQGVELGASYALTRTLRLSGNYTFIDSEVTKTQLDPGSPSLQIASRKGDPLTSVPEHMLNATLSWQATPRLETWLTAEYRSSAFRPRNYHEPHSGGNSQGQVGVGERDSRDVMGDFKGYTQFNLGAAYRVGNGVTLNGTIYNLLNKDFKNYKAFNTCSNEDCTNAVGSSIGYSNVYNTILEPRRLYVSLNVEF